MYCNCHVVIYPFQVRLRLAVHFILEWDTIAKMKKDDTSLLCSDLNDTLEDLLSRNGSVSQLGILLAALCFNISITVYYPFVVNRTSLADKNRLSAIYNRGKNSVKNVQVYLIGTLSSLLTQQNISLQEIKRSNSLHVWKFLIASRLRPPWAVNT